MLKNLFSGKIHETPLEEGKMNFDCVGPPRVPHVSEWVCSGLVIRGNAAQVLSVCHLFKCENSMHDVYVHGSII
jgi:hypothetical protein